MTDKELEKYFLKFREKTIGYDAVYQSPYDEMKLVYADWIASGRLYGPIEDKIRNEFGPFVANTHTETSEAGSRMTRAYGYAHRFIKSHVNAGNDDVIITAGSGMTTVVNKLQRILGLRPCHTGEKVSYANPDDRPIVFITHMEHHSNQTSWYETIAEVIVVEPDEDLLVDLEDLRRKLYQYRSRKIKIGSFTACSNVTGILTPYHEMAKIMHENEGLCFIDFAAAAPYVNINMHPADPMEKLDGIYFSPHKFLGGPGYSGVLVFDKSLYNQVVPDNPGGGTVNWTNPWGEYKYIDDIEVREDGGTPGFLQAIRTALAIELKNIMGVDNILKREHYLVEKFFRGLYDTEGIHILASSHTNRLGAISFYHTNIHYNLFVKLLSDRFGVQARGGCACAGTYGHYLLHVDHEHSRLIADKISRGDLSDKPGWVRVSLHPVMTDDEIDFIINAIREICKNFMHWSKDYKYSQKTNEYFHRSFSGHDKLIDKWFKLTDD
ncbi:MAG: aminotransferase class V-fold PLP-dependent enzyme [Bacteroidota bacterium]